MYKNPILHCLHHCLFSVYAGMWFTLSRLTSCVGLLWTAATFLGGGTINWSRDGLPILRCSACIRLDVTSAGNFCRGVCLAFGCINFEFLRYRNHAFTKAIVVVCAHIYIPAVAFKICLVKGAHHVKLIDSTHVLVVCLNNMWLFDLYMFFFQLYLFTEWTGSISMYDDTNVTTLLLYHRTAMDFECVWVQ